MSAVVTPSSTGTCTINSYQHNTNLTSFGFISSLISMESNCGFSETPWKILLQLGQKINFTLVDFSTETSQKVKVTAGGLHVPPLQLQRQQQQQQKQQLPNNRQQSQQKCKALYAIIKDLALSSKLVNVCGGGGLAAFAADGRRFIFRGGGGSGDSVTVNQSVVYVGRIKHIAVTNGNEAEVMFSQDILITGYHFLIVFEAIGCIEMDEPDGAWIKQNKTSAIIGCHGTHVTWLMTCTRGLWNYISKKKIKEILP
ncbi:hypothetical protein HELRODRAFT_160538 [Helobdella robusta]|uniref:Uncharacterized protein n=1 Tax=Helobdella robusta TaxID=6412 RepID=T1EQD9_HELRO|nr:hypothetical protein HELRODRAFT_160538 [Helobdella robusta]ESO06371.1 hypothetical protein HELRODRAFT_160538 [Helobdella robusta]